MRSGGTTRGKWRISNEKIEERSAFMFEAPKVVAITYVD
jgi:hypothetical protein